MGLFFVCDCVGEAKMETGGGNKDEHAPGEDRLDEKKPSKPEPGEGGVSPQL